MLRIEGHTKLTPEQAIDRAVQFFESYGLVVKGRTPAEVLLEGGGGGVDVFARDGEKGTIVEVLSREWDNQAKEFLHKLVH